MSIGTVVHLDLTVPDAQVIRDFYGDVLGWSAMPLNMGGYDDYVMTGPDGDPVGGICHARGENADMPAGWISCVQVPDLDAAITAATSWGGKVRVGPQGDLSSWHCAVIADRRGRYSGCVLVPRRGLTPVSRVGPLR